MKSSRTWGVEFPRTGIGVSWCLWILPCVRLHTHAPFIAKSRSRKWWRCWWWWRESWWRTAARASGIYWRPTSSVVFILRVVNYRSRGCGGTSLGAGWDPPWTEWGSYVMVYGACKQGWFHGYPHKQSHAVASTILYNDVQRWTLLLLLQCCIGLRKDTLTCSLVLAAVLL